MTNEEILKTLMDLEYSPEYICLSFILNDGYKEWFLNLINTDKKYKKLLKAMKPTIVQDFMKTMNDDKVNLNKYFRMRCVLDRADCFKAKRHRIECYARIMKVDMKVAYHLYCLDEKQAEDDMWNTVYERSIGEDYKEKYPIRHRRENAYYIDNDGTLKNIRYEKSNKQFYLYGDGIRYK